MGRTRWIRFCVALMGLAIGVVAAAAPTVTQITLVSEKRVARTVFEYTYRITVKNDAIAQKNLTATLTRVGAGTTIVDGKVVVGDLAPNGVSTPADTFIVKHDRALPFQASALVWRFSADSAGDIGKDVVFVPKPINRAALNSLPRDPVTNKPIIIAVQGVSLEYDETSRIPASAVASCVNWISTCHLPGTRELDDCARSAPKCSTSKPWLEANTCCPRACFDAYKRERLSGIEPADALSDVYIMDATCFPGVRGLNDHIKADRP